MTDTEKKEGKVTLVATRKAGDTSSLVTNGNDSFPEDSFMGSYATTSGGMNSVSIIEPTFKPGTLRSLTSNNNILLQCIEIMEVNVDGTGHSIELVEGATESEKEKKILEDFFDEPYPNKSMVSIRRELRADLESTGVGYLEVIRNVAGDVVMLNNLPSDDVRLLRYDDPVLVDRTITRGGVDIKVKVRSRERRFIQIVNGKKLYFKEFGSSRDLDRSTGLWSPQGTALKIQQLASEVLYFTLIKEAKTPYGVPRWINQLPSILGSRKAEEFNLDFFDAGGLPPCMVLVQGGYLGEAVTATLQTHLSGKGSKHRAVIVEAMSSSGSLDSAGSVKVTVERFGAERQNDSMFQQYDKNCEDHVRTAFRLPPIFTGRAQDYNLASANTSYLVAEAQVFHPERVEFDERMWWLVKALGVRNYVFKSKPISLTDVQTQLAAITLGLTNKAIESEGAVVALNNLAGLSLKYTEPPPAPEPGPQAHIDPHTNLPYDKPLPPPGAGDPKTQALPPPPPPPRGESGKPNIDPTKPNPGNVVPIKEGKKVATKADEAINLVRLADRWATALGLNGSVGLSAEEILIVKDEVSALTGDDQRVFNEALASKSLVGVQVDYEGLAELCGCAVHGS